MTRALSVMRSAAAAVLALLLSACASAPPATGGSSDRLYRSRCAACHRLYAPQDRTRDEWVKQVARMAPRAHLSDEERARLLEYLQASARDAR